LRHRRILIKCIVALLFIGLLTKIYYDTNTIEVRHYQIESPSLGRVLAGLKVAHLSDLHLKEIGLREKKVLEILKKEKPDLIFVTGDFISFKNRYEPSMDFFDELEARFGVFAVLGNTEYSNESGSCILCHEGKSKNLRKKQNLNFLRNSFFPLKINGRILNIVGVDGPYKKKSDLTTALKGVNLENPILLLAHSPEIFEETSNSSIEFVLCGHTHGGQFFITKYLPKLFPLMDSTLDFTEGFFQKGKTLMYVNRGIGTSLLPFRLGVKPEITFFTFSNSKNKEKRRIVQMNESDPIKTLSISNNPSKTIFTGLNLSSLIETFNILNLFDSFCSTSAPESDGTAKNPTISMNSSNTRRHTDQKILFDFESESDLQKLNWECHKWFELSQENVTHGKYNIKILLPPGQYPGIDFQEIQGDWSKYKFLKMDIFNPSQEAFRFHVQIDDHESRWEYEDRFDIDFELKPGMNHISIPTNSIRTNIHHRLLDLKKIKQMMVFVPNNAKKREIFLDSIRLE